MVRALLCLSIAACGSKPASPVDPPAASKPVQVERVALASHLAGEQVLGTVRARDSVRLAPTVMGKIVELHCTVGERVKAGAVVARLSMQELGARLAQARETLAQSQLERARSTKLNANGALPGAELELATSRERIARAAMEEAATMVGYTTIAAPFAGVVVAKPVAVGDLAMPGRPLCIVEDPRALQLEATIPEASSRGVTTGDAVRVEIDAIDGSFTGHVVEISPTADAASRTVLVKLALPQDARVRSGAFGRAAFPGAAVRAISVPGAAVIHSGQLEEVFVVDGDRARMRLVRTGHVAGDRVEIRSGLVVGDRVIVADKALVDGAPVTVAP